METRERCSLHCTQSIVNRGKWYFSAFIVYSCDKTCIPEEVWVMPSMTLIGASLKAAKHEKRLASTSSPRPFHDITYITGTTSIRNTSMKSLLVHEKIKDELTTYLASKSFSMMRQMTSGSLLLGEIKPRPHTQGNWRSLRLPRRSGYQTKPCIVLMLHREVPHLLGFKHPCN